MTDDLTDEESALAAEIYGRIAGNYAAIALELARLSRRVTTIERGADEDLPDDVPGSHPDIALPFDEQPAPEPAAGGIDPDKDLA
jgi:hypothetical protein